MPAAVPSPISDEVKSRLHKKLIDLVNHMDDLRQQKKAHAASLGEQIKGADKKAVAIGAAVKAGDLTLLYGDFDPMELDLLLQG